MKRGGNECVNQKQIKSEEEESVFFARVIRYFYWIQTSKYISRLCDILKASLLSKKLKEQSNKRNNEAHLELFPFHDGAGGTLGPL